MFSVLFAVNSAVLMVLHTYMWYFESAYRILSILSYSPSNLHLSTSQISLIIWSWAKSAPVERTCNNGHTMCTEMYVMGGGCGECAVWGVCCVRSVLCGSVLCEECAVWGVCCVRSVLCGECAVWGGCCVGSMCVRSAVWGVCCVRSRVVLVNYNFN